MEENKDEPKCQKVKYVIFAYIHVYDYVCVDSEFKSMMLQSFCIFSSMRRTPGFNHFPHTDASAADGV